MTPTTEQLKDLLANVTPDWRVSHVHDENGWYGSAVYMDDNEKVWLGNDYNSDQHDATIIALAPTLAAEVVRLMVCREALATLLVQANGVEPRDDALRRSVVRIARQALDATSAK